MKFPLYLKKAQMFFAEKAVPFLKNNFELSTSKRSRTIGKIVTVIMLIALLLDIRAYTSLEFSAKWVLLFFCFLFTFFTGAYITLNVKITNERLDKIWHLALIFLLPFLTISMTECLNNIFIYDMTYLGFFANYMLVLLFYFFFFALFGSLKVSVLCVNVPLFGLGLAHCYIMDFRGTPFIPMDFLSITTAKNVANTYNYIPNHAALTGIFLFIFIIALGLKLKTPKYTKMVNIVSRTFMGSFFAVVMLLFYFTSVFANAGVKPDFWSQSRGYRNYGFAFNFFCNTKYMFMSVPSGYDPTVVSDYVTSKLSNPSKDNDKAEKQPNIICIMNESLSDLKVLGNFKTNADYMPFMRSLKKNTVKGNLYVPVIGAGTSNTEFEFLTGHTTAFFPSGSNAYMLYIKHPLASLVSTLESQGYSSLAFHPYYSSGWNRVNVYNYMGFNSFKSIENLFDTDLMNEYLSSGTDPEYLQTVMEENFPDEKVIIRQYISDSYNYKMLINDFESRDKNVPYFAFNVTMQNHGGYTTLCSNFDQKIHLILEDDKEAAELKAAGKKETKTEDKFIKTNQYLSLVKESDDAFKDLIYYFKKVDEPTVICMFGDHQPNIETQFVTQTLGVKDLSKLTLEQDQNRHITPFIIWANYDIEEKYIERLSSNYLSTYVLKTANVKLTEYNQYLYSLSQQIPVVDTVGYIDSEGRYFRWNEETEYTQTLNEYERIQYNNVIDSENTNTDIFYINGIKPEFEEAKNAENSEETVE